ncbi:RNA polymerase sigma factor [Actinomadura opuntiae]|uniref:RNA polymerase sigma factor n=1 Tax=Actinomadura sp. OS1-43 TaxID=604315 RepID=UPI00255B16E1|nr:sigma-70 family RNA polymerase sigma factor [Actinomadura sp. OS1-43]MDL4818553.1 sigma-70 family RNA polymerase sigma factor [Actinomadura sp. OS1-43]
MSGDDAALVLRAQGGDTTAFERLVRRYSGPVYRIALRILNDAQAAEDVAQEAFVTAWRRLSDLRDGQAFAAWLYRIATTRALAAARQRTPDPGLESVGGEPGPAPAAADPEQHALAGDLLGALWRALARLTAQQRACWVLKELEGLSYDEIAEVTRTGPDAVRGRIHRARVRLAEELSAWR